MKNRVPLTRLYLIFSASVACAQSPFNPNENSQLTNQGNGNYTFSWTIRPYGLYYLMWSPDLAVWNYFPYALAEQSLTLDSLAIGAGARLDFGSGGAAALHGFHTNLPLIYVRAEFQVGLPLVDRDADGIFDYLEVLNHLDPRINVDSDSDLLADDWERFWFNGSLVQTGSGNGDGDAYTNREEYLFRMNPDSNDSVAAPSIIQYDLAGRVTRAGGLTYQYDEEGNVLLAR